mmetsp:Transcript_16027/g.25876  ORF Transcript_16027/g.25876 Transcript_16027/m.25876 type:complete len:209 (-) Transcript_16027:557-1183(-)
MGVATLYPGSAVVAGVFAEVTVSPTRASFTDLMLAMKYPTSPALSRFTGTFPGRIMPISPMVYVAPVFIIVTWSPTPMLPSMIRKMVTTPWYGSKYESKMSARSGWSPVSGGGGTLATICSKISSIPMLALAEATTASEQSSPSTSSISRFTRSGSAPGKSILFSTGMISSSASTARYTLATVCASTPCDASTTSSAPSHAASDRLTS